MSLDNDLNDITEKLRNLLLDCLIFFSSKPYLFKYKDKIYKMTKNLDSPLVISISGHFSSGKTSLVNALIGTDLLETDINPNTSTINYLTYSEKPFSKIIYKNGTEIEYSFDNLKSKLNKDNTSVQEIESIKKVLIGLPLKSLKFINVVDTPGLNVSEHDKTFISEDLTKEFMSETDGLIYAISQHTGGGSATDYNFLKKYSYESRKKVIGVITKVDQIEEVDFDTDETREQIINRIKNLILEEYKLKEYMVNVVPLVSLKRKINNNLIKYNIDNLKNIIIKEFEKPRKIVKLTRIISDLNKFLQEVLIDSKTDEILIKRKINSVKEGYNKFFQISREMKNNNYNESLVKNLENIVGNLIYSNLDELYSLILSDDSNNDSKLEKLYEDTSILFKKISQIQEKFDTISFLDNIEDNILKTEASNILLGTSDGSNYEQEQLIELKQKWTNILRRTYHLDKKNFIMLLLEEINQRIRQ